MLSRPMLALVILSASTLFGALTADASLPRDCYIGSPGYAIQMFHDQEAQVISWTQIYNQASSGSAREREADIKRRAHARAAIEVLSNPGAITQSPHLEINQLANRMTEGYNRSSSGSVLEQMYREARDLALTGYLQKGVENLNCETLSGDDALRAASTYQSMYNQASSGSRREQVALELRNYSFEVAGMKIEQTLRYSGMDFRSLENEAVRFQSLYNQASSGSRAESLYRRVRDIAYEASLQTYASQVGYLSIQELVSLEKEFHSRYNQASSGSMGETHFRSMRDLTRSEISRRQSHPMPVPHPMPHPVPHPMPVPAPVPMPNRCPDPNTHFDPRIQRCVANR